MFTSSEFTKCVSCSGFAKPVTDDGIGQSFICVQHCKLHCEYIFSFVTGKEEKLTQEKFITKDYKIVVNHMINRTIFYILYEKFPNIFTWKEISTRYHKMLVTPATAGKVFEKEKSTLILK